jgi:hypothetical protein
VSARDGRLDPISVFDGGVDFVDVAVLDICCAVPENGTAVVRTAVHVSIRNGPLVI